MGDHKMFTQTKAADYFVVAWCKNWTLLDYINAILEGAPRESLQEAVELARTIAPWLPELHFNAGLFSQGVKEFVLRAYPSLSDWLWKQKADIDRLKCAGQLLKLKPPAKLRGRVTDEDRREMKSASRGERQASTSYRASRDAFKTHQRSAWSVCK